LFGGADLIDDTSDLTLPLLLRGFKGLTLFLLLLLGRRDLHPPVLDVDITVVAVLPALHKLVLDLLDINLEGVYPPFHLFLLVLGVRGSMGEELKLVIDVPGLVKVV
jgi:hypothetical protein